MLYAILERGGAIKIGKADNPAARLSGLQGAHPYPLRLLFSVRCGRQALRAERIAHDALRERRLSGEWFAVTEAEARGVVAAAIRKARGAPVPEPVFRWVFNVTPRHVDERVAVQPEPAPLDPLAVSAELRSMGVRPAEFRRLAQVDTKKWAAIRAGKLAPSRAVSRRVAAALHCLRAAHDYFHAEQRLMGDA